MRLYDNARLLDINIIVYENDERYDYTNDFFADGNCEYNDDMDAWEVEDIDYCIDAANGYAAFDREYWDWFDDDELAALKEKYRIDVGYEISDLK